ncbi:unnamed protein product [Choristocarpus tenellus]
MSSVGPTRVLQWCARNHINFRVGAKKLRILPIVVHLLSCDLDWFRKDQSLFEELQVLLRDRVVRAYGDGDEDPETPKTRKRARREEMCVQGSRLQFTYRYRKTIPRFTVLTYAKKDNRCEDEEDSPRLGEGKCRGKFSHLPLSQSTLLVWVYHFDREHPYKEVPNEAALNFQSVSSSTLGASATKGRSSSSLGKLYAQGSTTYRDQEGAANSRDGLLAWIWGATGTRGRGGEHEVRSHHHVSQHFIGDTFLGGHESTKKRRASASLQDVEDENLQRAIQLSLADAEHGREQ